MIKRTKTIHKLQHVNDKEIAVDSARSIVMSVDLRVHGYAMRLND